MLTDCLAVLCLSLGLGHDSGVDGAVIPSSYKDIPVAVRRSRDCSPPDFRPPAHVGSAPWSLHADFDPFAIQILVVNRLFKSYFTAKIAIKK